MKSTDLHGLTVATVLPFDHTGGIDWASYDRLLEYCAMPDTVAAVFVNGHAGEGAALSETERSEVIRHTRSVLGPGKPLLAGVIAHGVSDAIAQARAAQNAGADCYVIFPPASLGGGAAATRDAPLAFFRAVTEAVDCPASVFQYPLASGLGYCTEALAAIAALPQVIAIKEGSNTMLAYEQNFRAVRKVAPDVAFLPSNFDWFMPQLAIGGDGLLSGLGSLAPQWLFDLWQAAQAMDLAAMRAANDRLHPLVRAIYGAAPIIDMHTRIKVGLKALGIIEHATPRLPLMPVHPDLARSISELVAMSDLQTTITTSPRHGTQS
jgi:4-hydroxy-tetrahydrodipicolinate synthase